MLTRIARPILLFFVRLDRSPLLVQVNTIDAVTLIQTVTDVAIQEWEERTKTRWDPLANFLETKGIVLTLPETTVNPGGEALVRTSYSYFSIDAADSYPP